jgi:hypothetical protein
MAATGESAATGDPRPPAAATGAAGLVLALALAAALLLLLAGPATVASVNVPDESCEALNDARPEIADRCALSGFERHGPALALLALVAAAAGFGARGGFATPVPALALLLVGVATVGIALIGDLPLTGETGAIGLDFETAEARAGLGFYLELTAGVLCLLAGALAASRPPAQP